MKVKLEVWASSEGRGERHYFIEGGDRGYQHNTYLFGYNPELVSHKLAQKILLSILEQLPDEDHPNREHPTR